MDMVRMLRFVWSGAWLMAGKCGKTAVLDATKVLRDLMSCLGKKLVQGTEGLTGSKDQGQRTGPRVGPAMPDGTVRLSCARFRHSRTCKGFVLIAPRILRNAPLAGWRSGPVLTGMRY
jgi:hypothetical protein